ncbi:regulator of chromosome condensation domain-containing protein, putative [Eimeria maxima]|uniref:Regulator of chromosome condensation domain-containing protein, putative n=1 Tax=Eimeria maxima TaxID=5804 RepID=U6M320_EIMMA|nr:regulator of chromosome condensation domain-containing protein, putative [Eimeria maxima]CDJ58607.1 regulator of chromosome condensation domain-containing protein, putative [Eimeria maxima]
MRRLIPCAGRSTEDVGPLNEDCVPVVSTDALVEPQYRDTRTIIYLWGRRLLRGEGEGDCVGDGTGCSACSPKELDLLNTVEGLHAPLGSAGGGGAGGGGGGRVSSPVCRRIAAKGGLSLCLLLGGQLLGWGQLMHAGFSLLPRLLYQFPIHHKVVQLAIGTAVILALTEKGQVLAWGDGTYGELAGGTPDYPLTGLGGFIQLSLKDSLGDSLPAIISVSSGGRHVLLLTEDRRLWAFGDNSSGQCGVPNVQTKCLTPKGFVRVLSSSANHQLYLWGHSADHKLIFTAATEAIVGGERQPGVALKSGLKSACCRPRLIYSMLHEKVSVLALGRDYTLVVTGDGGSPPPSSVLQSSSSSSSNSSSSSSNKSDDECSSNNSWGPSPHILTAADFKPNDAQPTGGAPREGGPIGGPPTRGVGGPTGGNPIGGGPTEGGPTGGAPNLDTTDNDEKRGEGSPKYFVAGESSRGPQEGTYSGGPHEGTSSGGPTPPPPTNMDKRAPQEGTVEGAPQQLGNSLRLDDTSHSTAAAEGLQQGSEGPAAAAAAAPAAAPATDPLAPFSPSASIWGQNGGI